LVHWELGLTKKVGVAWAASAIFQGDPALDLVAPTDLTEPIVSVLESTAAHGLRDLRSVVRRHPSRALNHVLHTQVDHYRLDHRRRGPLSLKPRFHQRLQDVADAHAPLSAPPLESTPQLGVGCE